MSETYENPPLIEALCEFQFDPETPWDGAIPGLLFDKLQDDFPEREDAKQLSISVSQETEHLTQHVSTKDRVHFRKPDNSALIQVGPRFLAINHLEPYEHWENFIPMIEQALSAYRDIVEPHQIQESKLRFINQIEIDKTEGTLKNILDRFFHFRPHLGSELEREFDSFILGINSNYNELDGSLKIQMSDSSNPSDDNYRVIFDLDFSRTSLHEFDVEKVLNWLNQAHDNIEETFEACISDDSRELFERIEE